MTNQLWMLFIGILQRYTSDVIVEIEGTR